MISGPIIFGTVIFQFGDLFSQKTRKPLPNCPNTWSFSSSPSFIAIAIRFPLFLPSPLGVRPAKLLQSSYNDDHVMPLSFSQSSSRTPAPTSDTPRRKRGRERRQTCCGFYVRHRDCVGNKKRASLAVF